LALPGVIGGGLWHRGAAMVRITVPHYFDFGADRELVGDDLVRPEAWDALRTKTTGPFAMPETRETWEATAKEHPVLRDRAEAIGALIDARGGGSIASYGVGGASLEYWLHQVDPGRRLLIGEYAPETVARLRSIFSEAEVHDQDLLADAPLDADWHLFHRIDTEFSNGQWRQVLENFADQRVLVAASEVIGVKDALRELRRGMKRTSTNSGRLRNRAAFEALWRHTHDAEPVDIADLRGWVLTPRS
jgi:hypothetical protein